MAEKAPLHVREPGLEKGDVQQDVHRQDQAGGVQRDDPRQDAEPQSGNVGQNIKGLDKNNDASGSSTRKLARRCR